MPGFDGFETAVLIRRRKRSAHVPIIFVTADYGEESRMVRGYALGAVDFIVSPVAPEILRSKVKVFVDLYLLAQQAKRQAEEHLALAEERAARVRVEEANRRSGFMANASAVLGRSLAIMAATRELPRLAIPFLCDASALTFRGDDGGEARTDLAWSDPADALSTQSMSQVECPWWRQAIDRVIASGQSETFDFTAPRESETGVAALPLQPLEIPSGTPVTTLAILPLIARGRTLGAFSLAMGHSGRAFHADDLAMAADFV